MEIRCKCVGMLSGGKWDKLHDICRRVYSIEYISPTITHMGGGNQEVKILEPCAIRMERTEEGKRLRKDYEKGEIKHGFNEFRKGTPREDGILNTLTSVQKDNYIAEPVISAIRGRNPENPSDRTAGCTTEQRLEINRGGVQQYIDYRAKGQHGCGTWRSCQKTNTKRMLATYGIF